MNIKQQSRHIIADKPKVTFVVFDDISFTNGYTTRLRRVLELFNGNIEATIIASSDNTPSKFVGFDGVCVKALGRWLLKYKSVPFPFKLIHLIIWNIELAYVLLATKCDVVYSVWDPLGFASVLMISRIKKYRVILEVHDIFSLDHAESGHSGILLKLDRFLERFVVRNADYNIALSQNTLEFYQPYNPRMEFVPVCFDTDVFRATSKDYTSDSRVVGLIGPFEDIRQKHYLEFLYSRIDDFDMRIHFLVIGQCDSKINNGRIKYTGYMASEQEYANQLAQLSAILVPEGVSTSGPLTRVLQPMSCAVPVFATPKALIGLDYVTPGIDLLVFEENQIPGKVNELIFNNALMAEIGSNGRKIVERYYSKEASAGKLLKILQSLLKESAEPSK